MNGEHNELVIIGWNVIKKDTKLITILVTAILLYICTTMYIIEYIETNISSISEIMATRLETVMKMNLHASSLVSTMMSIVILLQTLISWWILKNESKLQTFSGTTEERNKIVTAYWNSNFIAKLTYITVVHRVRKSDEEIYYDRTLTSASFKAWYSWKDKGGKSWIIHLTLIMFLIVIPGIYELSLLFL